MEEKLMRKCLEYCFKHNYKDDLPIAAMVVKKNKIISKAINNKNIKNNVMGHAEIIAINKATKKLKRWNLNDCELYVTLKPCLMCETIIREARIENVYYLVDKLDYKKPFQKTKFKEIENLIEVKKKYRLKLNDFFKNKR